METTSVDSFQCKSKLKVGTKTYEYFDLKKAEKNGLKGIANLPNSLKVLMENLLRLEDGVVVTKSDLEALARWGEEKKSDREISFTPARVLMQDFTGVPAVVDLASMRDAMVKMKGNPKKINPLSPVDLVIDHSLSVEHFGNKDSFKKNVDLEYEQNLERYEFLRWGQKAFDNFRVVPPGTGICHQVNLEYLAQTVWTKKIGKVTQAYPDTLVGTDSHTTMINGLAVLGWGVGGIEAEAAMLGQPVTMLIPEVVGMRLVGQLREGSTATDVVLTVTQMLRKKGVVGKFVEFFGEGLSELSLADRATIANMAPEYGATCGFFPIDSETVNFLKFTGRSKDRVALVEAYAKAQGMWRDSKKELVYTDVLELDLSEVLPCMAGPKRPQDRVVLTEVASRFVGELKDGLKVQDDKKEVKVKGADYSITHGDVVIAAITSCTNTSNPSVIMAAGLLAQKARAKGLTRKPWVKTSLAPGSQVVTSYLVESGLQQDLDAIGFNLVGYGCTTCIGNSGPLPAPISGAIQEGDLVAAAVLSGNRNFEGRVNPHVKANYLASPPLVVAYALAGSMKIDLTKDPIGHDKKGQAVYLKDIWPTNKEIQKAIEKTLTSKMFKERYADVFKGDKNWRSIKVGKGLTYEWDKKSTYIKNPPYFDGMKATPEAIESVKGARVLAVLGDSVTTDHISPAGDIALKSAAGDFLTLKKIKKERFNSYGARRGNHEVMMRGTFANIRLKNEIMGGKEGGLTKHMPDQTEMTIFDASMKYQEQKNPLVIFAGKEYGTGSSRDWAAKGTRLLGVKAVIAESFERIHRSNLIGMGVLPLQFKAGEDRKVLKLTGQEIVDIEIPKNLTPRQELKVNITRPDGTTTKTTVLCRIDTANEVDYYKDGGILHYVLRKLTQGK